MDRPLGKREMEVYLQLVSDLRSTAEELTVELLEIYKDRATEIIDGMNSTGFKVQEREPDPGPKYGRRSTDLHVVKSAVAA